MKKLYTQMPTTLHSHFRSLISFFHLFSENHFLSSLANKRCQSENPEFNKTACECSAHWSIQREFFYIYKTKIRDDLKG